MKILITGGHVTPALAVIDELETRKDIEVIFVGRKYSLDSERTLSFEYKSVKKRDLRFINLTTGRFTRSISPLTLLNLLRLPLGLVQSYEILRRERPDRILLFGGYIALPVALVGFLLGIPIFTHEQTLKPGLTNRIIGFFAHQVFVTFPETKRYFKAKKTVAIGNPIRKAVFIKGTEGSSMFKRFDKDSGKKVVYVTGGSLGSHSVNVHIENILSDLLRDFVVIHQCGDTEEYNDYGQLSKLRSSDYFVKKHFYESEIGLIYDLCDIVVARAGANTILEIIAKGKPSVLIPLPWAAEGEQEEHARLLKKSGIAEIFYQDNDSRVLLSLIKQVTGNLARYRGNFDKIEKYYKPDASKEIVKHLLVDHEEKSKSSPPEI